MSKSEVPDPHNLNLKCLVNGETMQNSSTNQVWQLTCVFPFAFSRYEIFDLPRKWHSENKDPVFFCLLLGQQLISNEKANFTNMALVTRLGHQSAGLQNRRASLMVFKILHSVTWGRHTHRNTARGGGVHETSKVLKGKYFICVKITKNFVC